MSGVLGCDTSSVTCAHMFVIMNVIFILFNIRVIIMAIIIIIIIMVMIIVIIFPIHTHMDLAIHPFPSMLNSISALSTVLAKPT